MHLGKGKDELFQDDAAREDGQREKVMEIPSAELFPFKDHPFKVVDDDAMRDTAESIEKYGVLVPGRRALFCDVTLHKKDLSFQIKLNVTKDGNNEKLTSALPWQLGNKL